MATTTKKKKPAAPAAGTKKKPKVAVVAGAVPVAWQPEYTDVPRMIYDPAGPPAPAIPAPTGSLATLAPSATLVVKVDARNDPELQEWLAALETTVEDAVVLSLQEAAAGAQEIYGMPLPGQNAWAFTVDQGKRYTVKLHLQAQRGVSGALFQITQRQYDLSALPAPSSGPLVIADFPPQVALWGRVFYDDQPFHWHHEGKLELKEGRQLHPATHPALAGVAPQVQLSDGSSTTPPSFSHDYVFKFFASDLSLTEGMELTLEVGGSYARRRLNGSYEAVAIAAGSAVLHHHWTVKGATRPQGCDIYLNPYGIVEKADGTITVLDESNREVLREAQYDLRRLGYYNLPLTDKVNNSFLRGLRQFCRDNGFAFSETPHETADKKWFDPRIKLTFPMARAIKEHVSRDRTPDGKVIFHLPYFGEVESTVAYGPTVAVYYKLDETGRPKRVVVDELTYYPDGQGTKEAVYKANLLDLSWRICAERGDFNNHFWEKILKNETALTHYEVSYNPDPKRYPPLFVAMGIDQPISSVETASVNLKVTSRGYGLTQLTDVGGTNPAMPPKFWKNPAYHSSPPYSGIESAAMWVDQAHPERNILTSIEQSMRAGIEHFYQKSTQVGGRDCRFADTHSLYYSCANGQAKLTRKAEEDVTEIWLDNVDHFPEPRGGVAVTAEIGGKAFTYAELDRQHRKLGGIRQKNVVGFESDGLRKAYAEGTAVIFYGCPAHRPKVSRDYSATWHKVKSDKVPNVPASNDPPPANLENYSKGGCRWPDTVRKYNGSGPNAEAYRDKALMELAGRKDLWKKT